LATDSDRFPPGFFSGNDLDVAFGNTSRPSQELNQGPIGFTLNRRRGELDPNGIGLQIGDFFPATSRVDLDSDEYALRSTGKGGVVGVDYELDSWGLARRLRNEILSW